MAENPLAPTPTAPTAAPMVDRAFVAQSEPQVMSGANWFWWIAGLSVVNTIMIHSGSETTLAIGLAVTLMADLVFKDHAMIAFGFDAVVLAIIFGLGFFARKGHFWAFVVGMVLYALDGGIYILLQGWMAVALHGLALFYMFRGAKQLRVSLKAAAEPPPVVVAAPPVVAG